MKTIIAICALLLAGAAYADKPPIFQPQTDSHMSYADKQIANKALDVLFDSCPAIRAYVGKVQSDYAMYFRQYPHKNKLARIPVAFWTAHRWHRILVLSMTVADVLPHAWTAASAVPAWRNKAAITLYMGTGDAPGIWIQTSTWGTDKDAKQAEKLLCGARKPTWIRAPGIKSLNIAPSLDAFIPAPGMRVIDSTQ